MYGRDDSLASGLSSIGDSAMSHGDRTFDAGILCFDEVQVTDPFAALALKGERSTASLLIPAAKLSVHTASFFLRACSV